MGVNVGKVVAVGARVLVGAVVIVGATVGAMAREIVGLGVGIGSAC